MVDAQFPNKFIRKCDTAVCVDCKGSKAVIKLASKNLIYNINSHVESSDHIQAAQEKGASTSKRITSIFKPAPKKTKDPEQQEA